MITPSENLILPIAKYNILAIDLLEIFFFLVIKIASSTPFHIYVVV